MAAATVWPGWSCAVWVWWRGALGPAVVSPAASWGLVERLPSASMLATGWLAALNTVVVRFKSGSTEAMPRPAAS